MTAKPPAASALLGLTLSNGWRVVSRVPRSPNATGGTFSHSYIVEKADRVGFLKAFDFSEAFAAQNTIELLRILTSAYEHERDILHICRDHRLSKIVIAIDDGDVTVPGYDPISGRVFYLIFEKAEGDIRQQVDQKVRFDAVWSIQALRDVSLGLWQVHRRMIAHQDMKPSNVLHYGRDGFRIADFGRSSRRGSAVWYDDAAVAGDRNYAPPEQLYGFRHPDFATRRFGCDLYMLGNLAAFMFAGVNITGSIFSRLDPQFHWKIWQGPYEQVLPYIQEAFTRLLEDLKNQIPEAHRTLIGPLIRDLCNPDLSRRGHPRGVGRHEQYSLERYVSDLTLLSQRIAIQERVKAKKQ
jgi:eukaryotic-like serine/threonine-protein kinase